ncbi:MAG: tetratricopeptide repeat protein, partial [Gemmatimonadales bacterium]
SRLLAPELLAYAHYLEDDAHYEEALDVLDTLLQVGGDRLSQGDAVATQLRWARVLRKMARFDEADAAYAEAGAQAETAGDPYAMLLSRIGRANILYGRGNLSASEEAYRRISAEAGEGGYREAQARAEHGLGATLDRRGQPTDAVPHIWRSFELYEDEASRLRALNDLGVILLALGDAQGAERALLEVVRRGGSNDNTNNATVELMDCASYRRDRVGFERWRLECEARVNTMTPNTLADFYLKLGIGNARFGNFRKAKAPFAKALDIATAHGLHEFEFRIERISNGLHDCEMEATHPIAAEPVHQNPELLEVSASLARLGS